MKKVISVVLILITLALCWVLYRQFATPMEFIAEKNAREVAVIQRLKDIRAAERAFKQVNQRYTGSFDTLIDFVLHDSMTYDLAVGSADDSLAMAQGRVRIYRYKMPVKDTIFSGRNFTEKDIQDIRIVPHSNGKEFLLDASKIITESTVEVPVFFARAPYKYYLSDLDEQELINIIDEYNTMNKYAGLKVGSLTETTNDAGNWE